MVANREALHDRQSPSGRHQLLSGHRRTSGRDRAHSVGAQHRAEAPRQPGDVLCARRELVRGREPGEIAHTEHHRLGRLRRPTTLQGASKILFA